MHGLVRFRVVASFAADMAKNFKGTVLPGSFVYSFGLVLPFLETLIGNRTCSCAVHKIGASSGDDR
jgi:hypothetical protein